MTDIPDDIMKAARKLAAKACSESHSAQGKGSILAASPFDCARRAAEAAILAERLRCAELVEQRKTAAIYLAGRGHASIGTNIVVHGFDEIAAAIMKGPAA